MDTKDEPTVEMSLQALSEALGKASGDLCAVRETVDLARCDMASHNGSHSRALVRDAERVVTHLRETEECLYDVLKDLSETD